MKPDKEPVCKRVTNGYEFALRQILLERQELGICAECGFPIEQQCEVGVGCGTHIEIDHIVEQALGGTSDHWNLQIMHERCNRTKGQRNVRKYADYTKFQSLDRSAYDLRVSLIVSKRKAKAYAAKRYNESTSPSINKQLKFPFG